MKLANSKDKEKILKAARDKTSLNYMGKNIRLTTDLSTENWQARKGWQDIFRVLNEKNLHLRILYPARLSFRIGEIKSFQDRQDLKESVATKPALQEMLGGRCKRGCQKNPQKQGLNSYYDDTKFISFHSNFECEWA